jgi:hypothetical protein
MGVFKEEEEEDLDQSFEADTDALLRVKAKVMFNINKERQLLEIPILNEDLTLATIAMKYAASIKSGHIDEAYLNRLAEQEKFLTEFLTCQIVSKYEDDTVLSKKYT